MTIQALRADSPKAGTENFLAKLETICGDIRRNAQILDPDGVFPSGDVAALHAVGAIAAPVPVGLGGLGIGTDVDSAQTTAEILFLIGQSSVALGRIYEAHVNAIRLVMRYGTPAIRQATAADAHAGHLHALWVTDADDPVRFCYTQSGVVLTGRKSPCSAAGHATRAVITATCPAGHVRLLRLSLDRGEAISPLSSDLQGVRAAATGSVDFTACQYETDVIFGDAGDYLQEPDFSAGAWRTSAITAGALWALVQASQAELLARGRANHPQQQERLGRMLINAQTARLWVRHVTPFAEDPDRNPDHTVAIVNLARIAIEAVCLDTIQLVQRSLGLSALHRSNPLERICRDVATYLRQPAPDEALSAATQYLTHHQEQAGLFR